MNRPRSALALLAALLLLTACGATRDPEPIPPPRAASTGATTPTASPTPAPLVLHDPATRAGVPQVDAVIDAVLRRDAAAVARLVELTEMPCIDPERGNTGYPPCIDGRPEGEIQAVFPSGSCEPNFLFSLQDARQHVADMLDASLGLYAVWEPRSRPEPTDERPAAWAVMFAVDRGRDAGDARQWRLWIDEGGAIIGQVRGCNSLPAPLDGVTDPADRVILPPPPQPAATSP